MAREIKVAQEYRDRLLKLIPSELVGAYLIIAGVIPAAHLKWGSLIASAFLMLLTPFYLARFQGVRSALQISFTTLSFAVWVYSLGGPFEAWGLYQPWLSSVILVLWTVTVPLFVNPRTEPAPA